MATSPVDICNVALAEGATRTSINGFPPIDNSPAAVAGKAFYTPKTQMILRGVHWDFARRQENLSLLKAAVINGQISTDPPPQPWAFEYLYPPSCLKARFLIQYQQPSPSGTPFTTGPSNIINPAYAVTRVPFVIANDPDSQGMPRKVILTNMQNAMLVYTQDLSQFPDMWDAQFLAGVTATLASYFIASLSADKGLMQLQIGIAKGVLDSARATNGNENLGNQDHIPDWIQARAQGVGWGGWNYGSGMAWYNGWDQCSFPDGLTF